MGELLFLAEKNPGQLNRFTLSIRRNLVLNDIMQNDEATTNKLS